VVELQCRWLREIEMEKGRRWGAAIFRGKEGEEARRPHGARGEQHSKERRSGWGGRIRQPAARGQR
jgi:hypothetical protein